MFEDCVAKTKLFHTCGCIAGEPRLKDLESLLLNRAVWDCVPGVRCPAHPQNSRGGRCPADRPADEHGRFLRPYCTLGSSRPPNVRPDRASKLTGVGGRRTQRPLAASRPPVPAGNLTSGHAIQREVRGASPPVDLASVGSNALQKYSPIHPYTTLNSVCGVCQNTSKHCRCHAFVCQGLGVPFVLQCHFVFIHMYI